MEITGVRMLIGSLSTTHAIPLPRGTAFPIGAIWVISPGTNPRLQTLAANACWSKPAPCTKIQTISIAARMV